MTCENWLEQVAPGLFPGGQGDFVLAHVAVHLVALGRQGDGTEPHHFLPGTSLASALLQTQALPLFLGIPTLLHAARVLHEGRGCTGIRLGYFTTGFRDLSQGKHQGSSGGKKPQQAHGVRYIDVAQRGKGRRQ